MVFWRIPVRFCGFRTPLTQQSVGTRQLWNLKGDVATDWHKDCSVWHQYCTWFQVGLEPMKSHYRKTGLLEPMGSRNGQTRRLVITMSKENKRKSPEPLTRSASALLVLNVCVSQNLRAFFITEVTSTVLPIGMLVLKNKLYYRVWGGADISITALLLIRIVLSIPSALPDIRNSLESSSGGYFNMPLPSLFCRSCVGDILHFFKKHGNLWSKYVNRIYSNPQMYLAGDTSLSLVLQFPQMWLVDYPPNLISSYSAIL